MALILRTILEYVEVAIQLFVHLANARQVVKAVAVVRGGPHCCQLAIKQLLEALLTDLMRSIYPDAAIRVQKSLHHVRAKHVPCATI